MKLNLRLFGFLLYREKEKAFSISQKTLATLINIVKLKYVHNVKRYYRSASYPRSLHAG